VRTGVSVGISGGRVKPSWTTLEGIELWVDPDWAGGRKGEGAAVGEQDHAIKQMNIDKRILEGGISIFILRASGQD
jgi:hypothetical protein